MFQSLLFGNKENSYPLLDRKRRDPPRLHTRTSDHGSGDPSWNKKSGHRAVPAF